MEFEVFKDSICVVHKRLSIIFFIFNIIIPGFGTMLSSCFDEGDMNTDQFIIGVFQLFLAILIIGWVWSIWWGWLIYKKSR
ncbi:unnamed protein product [Moneuplotes crassus]|uniref:Uncharacterized protein n=1 Tax=Euplotes crassus TaxID=5936 RepID=A0AAD2D8A3_EUPCR|nr:unnamed protein product [Moneuplotes crassus]